VRSGKDDEQNDQSERSAFGSGCVVWNSLSKTFVNSDSVAVFKSGLKTFLFSRAFSFPSSHSTLPGPSASEVTTLWRYTNLFIIIIIILKPTSTRPQAEKLG